MMVRRVVVAGAFLTGAVGAAACQPVLIAGGSPPPPCYVGTFSEIGANVASAVNASVLGAIVNVTPVAGGTLGLTVTGSATSGTWSLSGDQSFDVTAAAGSPLPVDGTAAVTGLAASGSYTANTAASTITLSLGGPVGGTFAFTGTPISIGPETISQLASTFPVDDVLGIGATVTYQCTTSPPGVQLSVPVHNPDGSTGVEVEDFRDA